MNNGNVTVTYGDGSTATWEASSSLLFQAGNSLYELLGPDPVISVKKNDEAVDRRPAPVIPKNDIAYLFQLKRDNLLEVMHDYRESVEAGTLGDYSELGFLANILQALMKD